MNKIYFFMLSVFIVTILGINTVFAADTIEDFEGWGFVDATPALSEGVYTYNSWRFVAKIDGVNANDGAIETWTGPAALSISTGSGQVDELRILNVDGNEFNFGGFNFTGSSDHSMIVTGWRDGVKVTEEQSITYTSSTADVYFDMRSTDPEFKNIDEIRICGADLGGGNYDVISGYLESLTYDTDPIDEVPPIVSTLTMTSNNANAATVARAGDTITLNITANEAIQSPTVTLANNNATISDAGDSDERTWKATYIMQEGDSSGVVPFTLDFCDKAGNAATQVTAVTVGSSVTFDNIAPTAPTEVTVMPVGGTVIANSLNKSNTNMTATATITATEATGGKAEIYVDGTLLATDNTIAATDTQVTFDLGKSTTAELQAAVVSGGTVSVKLYDMVGNSSMSSVGNPTLVVDYSSELQSPPTITVQAITGILKVGETLTGHYIYSDVNGDLEGTSTFKWYRADNSSGLNKSEIAGATSATYVLQAADAGKYISFEVTPVALTGTTLGVAVESEKVGVIEGDATAPVGYSVAIDQEIINNANKTAMSFTFSGAEVGAAYSYTVSSSGGGVLITGNGNIVSVSQQITGIDTSSLSDGTLTLIATLTDVDGNTGIAVTDTVSKDTKIAPTINTQPSDAAVNLGGNTSFTVAATGTGLTYQWQVNTGGGFGNIVNGGSYSGATTSTLSITGVTASMNGYEYRVVVAGTVMPPAISHTATLTVSAAPTATVQAITGTLQVGATLTGHYIYSDVNSDLEGTSTFKWYRADNSSGLNKSEIAGATSATYVLQAADASKYISFEVTPVALTGTTLGAATSSTWAGAIGLVEAAPTAAVQPITGTLQVGATLTGHYTYSDVNGDLEGTSTFKWYRADNSSGLNKSEIAGATSATYVLQAADASKYISFEVTPVAQTGTTLGAAIESAKIGPIFSTSSGGSGGGSSSTTTTQPSQNTVVVVNGKEQNAGKETLKTEDGKATVTVELNNKDIESKIDEAIKTNITGTGNVIQVPISDTKSEVAKVELTGDIVKKLEKNNFDVSVKRDNVEYIIPAEELTISKVAEKLGILEKDLKDIKVEVQMTKLDKTMVAKYNEIATANGSELVFPPITFEVFAKTTNTEQTTDKIEISKFSNFVERIMEIPTGIDPNKITTGIVFNVDGAYSHVPTNVFQKDGKWFARLNSLTNSNYSVIWNKITVKSVENHWAKDTVNDMASRLIIFNVDTFEPNKAITRADFAEYIVRALGIYREGLTHENNFKDVNATGARTLAILIANEYGIVSGYKDGTFRGDYPITREEAMVMYQKAMNIANLIGTDKERYQTYTDYAKVSDWAAIYVKDVLAAHVFNGKTSTTISPKENLTYAEATQAIKNLLVESKLINM